MKAVKKAILLSKKFNFPLLSLFVLEESPIPKIRASTTQYSIWMEKKESDAQTILNSVEELGNKADIDIYTMLLHGSAAEKIIDEAKNHDLIVMGRHGHSSIDRVLLGSVSENVVHHTDTDVLIVK